MEAWGFTPRSPLTWIKPRLGLGQLPPQRHRTPHPRHPRRRTRAVPGSAHVDVRAAARAQPQTRGAVRSDRASLRGSVPGAVRDGGGHRPTSNWARPGNEIEADIVIPGYPVLRLTPDSRHPQDSGRSRCPGVGTAQDEMGSSGRAAAQRSREAEAARRQEAIPSIHRARAGARAEAQARSQARADGRRRTHSRLRPPNAPRETNDGAPGEADVPPQESRATTAWVFSRLQLPRPLKPEQVDALLLRLAADRAAPPLVFEARAEAGELVHHLVWYAT